jgi:hypothetical protein
MIGRQIREPVRAELDEARALHGLAGGRLGIKEKIDVASGSMGAVPRNLSPETLRQISNHERSSAGALALDFGGRRLDGIDEPRDAIMVAHRFEPAEARPGHGELDAGGEDAVPRCSDGAKEVRREWRRGVRTTRANAERGDERPTPDAEVGVHAESVDQLMSSVEK